MKSSQLPPQRESKESDKEEDPLEQQFKILEHEWSFFKQSNPPKNSHCSTTDSNVTDDYFQLPIKTSPRDQMSSLQQRRRLPSEGYWRHNERVEVEILKDRWDAIESGTLKGRRLFEDFSDGETEEDVCSECFNLVQESEGGLVSTCGSDGGENENVVRRLDLDCSYCYSSSFSESEGIVEGVVVMKNEKAERKMEVKSGNCGLVGYRKLWMAIVIASIGVIVAFCIISRKFNGVYVEEVTLVPT